MKLLPGMFLAFLVHPATQVLAQDTDQSKQPSIIRTSGESTVISRPDQVQIEIGVVTQGQTAEAATSQNAQVQEAVLKKLRGELDKSAEVKTVSYSVTPLYRYPKDGVPAISGYSAANVIQVTTGDLSRTGKIIDTALQAGANQIQRLRFTLKDEQAAELAALRDAAAKAKAKAEALAGALNLRILRIRQVDEGEGYRPPIEERQFALAQAAPRAAQTAVEPGTVEVRARVTMAVEVAPR